MRIYLRCVFPTASRKVRQCDLSRTIALTLPFLFDVTGNLLDDLISVLCDSYDHALSMISRIQLVTGELFQLVVTDRVSTRSQGKHQRFSAIVS